MIEIDDVSYRHGSTLVLQDINLRLSKGGVTALIGPNGAGKSTLLALMARLLPLQAGIIRFDGLDVSTTPSRELARKLAILRQDTVVSTRLSVKDLVGFGRYPHHRGRPGHRDDQCTHLAMEEFELLPIADRYIDTLSGGQRQRALVAMAFCQDTDYLLLDEPLNNLDMHFARDLMTRLRRLADRLGRTVVIVVHDINYAATYADTVIALKGGRIAAQGSPGQIIERDQLARIYQMDVKVITVDGAPLALHHARPGEWLRDSEPQ